jgi:hypothetical protein
MADHPKSHKRFRDLLPPLTDEEAKELEKRCVADGRINEPLVTWKDKLVDGYHRLAIAKKHNLDYQIRCLDPTWTEDQVCDWILSNQLGRRNLSRDAYRDALGQLYNLEKKTVGRPKLDQSDPIKSGETAEKIAKKTGSTAPTVKRAGARSEAIDSLPKTIQQRARSGQEKLTDTQVKQLASTDKDQLQLVDRAVRVKQAPDVKTAYKQVTGKALTGTKAKPAPAADNGQPDVKKQIGGVLKSIVKHRAAMAEWVAADGLTTKAKTEIKRISKALDTDVYMPLDAVGKGLKAV